MNSNSLERVTTYLQSLQTDLIAGLEAEETSGDRFIVDEWTRPEGGGGITRVIESGETFDKAGVNFSHVTGENLPPSATATRPQLAGRSFHATGVSVVIHPRNPYVPTAHANVRFFWAPARSEDEEEVWWFGGGFDLTPYYGFEEDAIEWHRKARAACAPFGTDCYPQFKAACDDYFYLKHRAEPRGIGGLFFDDFDKGGFESAFSLMRSVGDHFGKAYMPIVQRRKDTEYGERERAFQHYRRGRYVEFNLVYDRGTHFGLQSGGRVESILMSLPSQVSWKYDYHPEPGTREANLYDTFLVPQNWAEMRIE